VDTSDGIACPDLGDAVASNSVDRDAPPASPLGNAAVDHREAFLRWLHDEYAGHLLRVVIRFTDGDRYWAEDVVQETLLRAWRHADLLTGDRTRSLLPWLTTVARHVVINDLRRRKARPREVSGVMLATASVEDETERLLQQAVIVEALNRLTVAHRTVIIETYLRGRSVVEVAAILGIPVGTVKSRLHHALRALRALLPPGI
jgi:RNA polymerase sigma-70 factor (ECF subfamily)